MYLPFTDLESLEILHMHSNPQGSYQGVRNVSFSENFVYVLNGWTHSVLMCLPVLTSTLQQILKNRNKGNFDSKWVNGEWKTFKKKN